MFVGGNEVQHLRKNQWAQCEACGRDRAGPSSCRQIRGRSRVNCLARPSKVRPTSPTAEELPGKQRRAEKPLRSEAGRRAKTSVSLTRAHASRASTFHRLKRDLQK